jgi:hypothetical protein
LNSDVGAYDGYKAKETIEKKLENTAMYSGQRGSSESDKGTDFALKEVTRAICGLGGTV